MRLSQLKRASGHEVEKWLKEELKLTDYQKSLLFNEEIIRFSPFEFYERAQKEPASFLWRLTIVFFPAYFILLTVGLPIRFVVTGRWGYSDKFYDNFHAKWIRKVGL